MGGSETGKDKETEQSFVEKEGVVKSEEGRWEGVKQSVREGGSNSERSRDRDSKREIESELERGRGGGSFRGKESERHI